MSDHDHGHNHDHHFHGEDEELEPLEDVDESFVAARRPEIATVIIDGEAVCYDTDSFKLHVLNGTATLLWDCFQVPGTLGELIDDLVAELHVDRELVRADVLETTRAMVRNGLVRHPGRVDEAGDNQPVPAQPRYLEEPGSL